MTRAADPIAWRRVDAAPRLTGPLLMDAELAPHRAASGRAIFWVLIAMGLVCGALSLMFWVMGAFPVAGFLGLDVLALWLAFRASRRQALARERVQVAPDALAVTRRDSAGRARHWQAPAYWARVEAREAAVMLRVGPSALALGRALPIPERAHFATALREALARAKTPAIGEPE